MLVLTIFAMLCLLLIMYIISQNLLFPPVIFTGVWLLSLAGVLLSGDIFYELHETALLVYLVGATAFSVGGMLVLLFMQENTNHAQIPLPNMYSRRAIHRFLDAVLIIFIAALPLYWREISSVADDVSTDLLLNNIRYKQVEAATVGGGAFSLINNLGGMAQFLALIMFYELDGSRRRRWCAIVAVILAVVYGGMTGTKGGVVTLLLTLYFISAIKARQLKVLPLLGTIGLALIGFAVGVVVINMAFESYASADAILFAILEQILTYWLGGIVGFQIVAENPDVMESTQPIYRFFLETARSLGMSVELPLIHADFTKLGPTVDGNVYTIYFTYYKDWGWLGTAIIMLALGGWLTVLYKRAMQGRIIVSLFYAMMLVGLVMSISGEKFFLGLNGYIKALMLYYVVYWLIPSIGYKPSWKLKNHA